MESGEWKALLTLIPEEHQNHLVVMTTAGTEINIQTVLRLEEKYLVLRGRLAGTTDMGRIFFLPLDRLDYLAFQRALTEEEILAILGGQPMPGKEASESVPAVAPTAAAGLAPSQPEASAGPVPVAGPTPPLPSPPRRLVCWLDCRAEARSSSNSDCGPQPGVRQKMGKAGRHSRGPRRHGQLPRRVLPMAEFFQP